VYNECKTTNQKIWNGVFLNVSWTYNRCTKSGNRKNATGETGIRQKRNVTPESIGLVSIKAQADIRNDT